MKGGQYVGLVKMWLLHSPKQYILCVVTNDNFHRRNHVRKMFSTTEPVHTVFTRPPVKTVTSIEGSLSRIFNWLQITVVVVCTGTCLLEKTNSLSMLCSVANRSGSELIIRIRDPTKGSGVSRILRGGCT